MNGNEAYELKWNRQTDRLVDLNYNKPYLQGYRNYISDSSCTTIYCYVRHVSKFMDYLNNKPIARLELDDYTNYLSYIKNTSASNQIAVYAALKQFSLYLLAAQKNKNNPMQYIKRPKFKELQQTQEKREIGYLDKKEITQYLRSIDGGIGNQVAKSRQMQWKNRDKLIILLFLTTGMRCSALCKLDIDNIDIQNQRLVVIDKGGKVQNYELSNQVIELLNKWLIQRFEILKEKHEEALFVTNRRKRMSKEGVGCVVRKYAECIEGKHVTPHKLRATYGTQLYNATHDLYLVQQCMGHSNPKTTELYIRGQKDIGRKKASEIMSKIVEQ